MNEEELNKQNRW